VLGELAWRGALREPRTWGIVARHMIPAAGVVALDWSGIQAISVIALDTLAGLWAVAFVGAVLAAREMYLGKEKDVYNAVVTGALVFAILAGLLTVVVGVVAFVIGGHVLQRADFDVRDLLANGWAFWAFGGLLLFQAPHAAAMLATTSAASAKSVLEPRTGYLLRRFILTGMACSILSFLWGRAAIVGALVVSQLVLAAHEVFGDRLHAVLFPEPAAASTPSPPNARRKRRRRRT
jgi:hypothetical protein